MLSWRSWKTVLGLLVVFAAGGVFGAVLTLGAVKREIQSRMDSATWTPRAMKWIRESGDLTPAQEDAVRGDVESAVGELVNLRTSAEQERKAILAALFGDILPKLDPPQREKLTQAVRDAAAQADAAKSSATNLGRP